MSKKKINPCSYKLCCKKCKYTNENDRPKSCELIKCEYYTPCRKCGNNLSLAKGLCRTCSNEIEGTKRTETVDDDNESIDEIDIDIKEITESAFGNEDTGDDIVGEVDVSVAIKTGENLLNGISIGMPGTCPSGYNDECQKYYASQWDQYRGFYRDPTVYSMLHILIILEIELNQIIVMQAVTRSEASIALEKKRESLIKSINDIRKNLPTADAGKLSEGELALSSIYNKYISLTSQNTNGRLRRVLSPEIVALAPVLHYSIDMKDLLIRMGYKIADVKKICDYIDQIPKSPDSFAKFMGFPIDKETVADELGEEIEFVVNDEEDNATIDYEGIVSSG